MESNAGLVNAVSSGETGSSTARSELPGSCSAWSVGDVCRADGSAAAFNAEVVVGRGVAAGGAAVASLLVWGWCSGAMDGGISTGRGVAAACALRRRRPSAATAAEVAAEVASAVVPGVAVSVLFVADSVVVMFDAGGFGVMEAGCGLGAAARFVTVIIVVDGAIAGFSSVCSSMKSSDGEPPVKASSGFCSSVYATVSCVAGSCAAFPLADSSMACCCTAIGMVSMASNWATPVGSGGISPGFVGGASSGHPQMEQKRLPGAFSAPQLRQVMAA